jgi:hypothetical protein
MSPKKTNPATIHSSSDMIDSKSCGLFLWVRLVIWSFKLNSPESHNNIRTGNSFATTVMLFTGATMIRGINAYNIDNNTTWMARHGAAKKGMNEFWQYGDQSTGVFLHIGDLAL